jgi:hypothetical protein
VGVVVQKSVTLVSCPSKTAPRVLARPNDTVMRFSALSHAILFEIAERSHIFSSGLICNGALSAVPPPPSSPPTRIPPPPPSPLLVCPASPSTPSPPFAPFAARPAPLSWLDGLVECLQSLRSEGGVFLMRPAGWLEEEDVCVRSDFSGKSASITCGILLQMPCNVRGDARLIIALQR